MTLWTAADIAAATGGVAHADFAASGVAFDSREVGPGDLFVALSGTTTDGHRFLDDVFARGAAGALVSQPTDHPVVQVADTTAALAQLGAAARTRMAGKVIGVTGSVGKTSTKEMLFAALDRGAAGAAHRSVKSYNNAIGVPLSLARMPAAARYGVFEMGMNHAGEIAALTRLVRPHVAIITTVASVHLEHFRDEAGIADAKAEIFEGLEPGGAAIIPYDNIHRDRLIAAALAVGARIITFGTSDGADIRAQEVVRSTGGGSFVSAVLMDRELGFTIGQPGDHLVHNALAVLAAVEAVGGDVAIAGLALADMAGLAGRGARVAVSLSGGGGALILDESYNANPTSMRATLAVLGAEPARRRIAVLGQMGELGLESASFHAGLAAPVMAAGVSHAILVGEGMRALANALEGQVEFVHVAEAQAAMAALEAVLRDGDVVLVKGSNSVGLSTIVAALSGGRG